MNTQYTQIKLNLTLQLAGYLRAKADKYSMPLASYIKHLVLKDVEDVEYPIFEPSERTIKAYKQALKDRKKAIRVEGDIAEFLEKL